MYQDTPQVLWTFAHDSIDTKKYSTSTTYIMSMMVFSDIYQLIGKIDIYNKQSKTLIERKNKVHKVYDGYKYQLYAQYFCMEEMWYSVENLTIYSLTDNIKYSIPVPKRRERDRFKTLLAQYRSFVPNDPWFTQNPKKCAACIYKELCDYYLRSQ